jgi:hypothetical protein
MRYTAQLIEIKETTIYMQDGIVIAKPENVLLHAIYGETRVMKTETVVARWNLKTKKEADKLFWDYCTENNADFRNYYVVFDN